MLVSARERRAGARKGARPARGRGEAGRGGATSSVGREKVSGIQRARMLTAMTEVAAERGAANATVAHVVSRSGVSRRTFYEMFSDREDCLTEAFEVATARAGERVIPAYQAERTWQAQLRAGIAALLLFVDEEPDMGRLLIVEALGGGPRVLAYRAEILARLVTIVDEGRGLAKTKPPPLTAEGVLGGAFALVHARLLTRDTAPLTGLLGPLMGLIVGPYLGPAAARKEIERPAPTLVHAEPREHRDPLRGLDMRLTYRTVRVLTAVGAQPGASNRMIAQAAGVEDQGQISKLLRRLESLGLIHNTGEGHAKGEPNVWTLTPRGDEVEQAIKTQTG
jgi:AcrR family transcriptional regulator/DNA-binding MarR family transcriptional regulator